MSQFVEINLCILECVWVSPIYLLFNIIHISSDWLLLYFLFIYIPCACIGSGCFTDSQGLTLIKQQWQEEKRPCNMWKPSPGPGLFGRKFWLYAIIVKNIILCIINLLLVTTNVFHGSFPTAWPVVWEEYCALGSTRLPEGSFSLVNFILNWLHLIKDYFF